MFDFFEPDSYNFYCIDCNESFTYKTKEHEVVEKDGNYCIVCPYCKGTAHIKGRPAIAVRTNEGTSLKLAMQKYADDEPTLTKIQEHGIAERQKEIRSSAVARRKYESQRKAAMANKAEWVRRGRRPEERRDAING